MAERSEEDSATTHFRIWREGAGKNPQHVVTDKDDHGVFSPLVVSLQKWVLHKNGFWLDFI